MPDEQERLGIASESLIALILVNSVALAKLVKSLQKSEEVIGALDRLGDVSVNVSSSPQSQQPSPDLMRPHIETAKEHLKSMLLNEEF